MKVTPRVSQMTLNQYSNYSHSSSSSSENYNNFFMKYIAPLLVVGIATSIVNKDTKNCGIIGIVGDDHVKDHLLEGLTILQNRGYDSAGMCVHV